MNADTVQALQWQNNIVKAVTTHSFSAVDSPSGKSNTLPMNLNWN